MELTNYKTGDAVEVLMKNPQTNHWYWKDAEVLDIRKIYPSPSERFKPYLIIIVRTKRTYCKATPIFKFITNIPVFVDNSLEFYEKETDEGIIYEKNIRLKQ